jgi:predicted nucleic acid-binding protein
VNVYLESSAALRDVLGAEHGDHIRADVQAAETVVASRLTLAEVSRRMTTLRAHDPVAAETVAARAAEFFADSERWVVDPLDDAVWRRCERPFPIEPLRTLDAIHLATIEKVSAAVPRLVVLSTDERVRRNAQAMGFDVRP